MMKKNYRFAFLLIVGLAVAGCIDKNYDLDKLDKTIAIGSEKGFYLPGNNSTSEISLSDVIDLEGNDIISVSDGGDYYITRKVDEGEVDPATPVVSELTLTSNTEVTNFDYNLAEVARAARTQGPRLAAGSTAREIYHFEFNSNSQNTDIISLTTAEFTTNINIVLDYSGALKEHIADLKSYSVDFPDYFNIAVSEKNNGAGQFAFDSTRNILTVTSPTGQPVILHLVINGMRFTDGEACADGNSASYSSGRCSVVGGVVLDVDYQGNINEMTQGLVINCTTSMDKDITLTKATGYFNPAINLGENGGFDINNLPEILDDEEAHLNLSDPELRIFVSSDADIRGILTAARIIAVDTKGRETAVDVDVDSSQLLIDPFTGEETDENGNKLSTTKTTLVITDNPPQQHGSKSHTYYATTKKGSKLADLFYNIPRRVKYDISVAADPTYEGTVKLGYRNAETQEPWYTIQPSYEFYAPLSLNEGSAIVYCDSITGWHKDLEDVTLSQGSTITLTANVYNELPLTLKMHAKAIEQAGEEQWKDMDTNMIEVNITDPDGNDVRIKAGSVGAPAVTPVRIVMDQKNTRAFKKIDGLAYSATCLAPEAPALQGTILNERSQKLRVDNIGIILKGKVIIDLND